MHSQIRYQKVPVYLTMSLKMVLKQGTALSLFMVCMVKSWTQNIKQLRYSKVLLCNIGKLVVRHYVLDIQNFQSQSTKILLFILQFFPGYFHMVWVEWVQHLCQMQHTRNIYSCIMINVSRLMSTFLLVAFSHAQIKAGTTGGFLLAKTN